MILRNVKRGLMYNGYVHPRLKIFPPFVWQLIAYIVLDEVNFSKTVWKILLPLAYSFPPVKNKEYT